MFKEHAKRFGSLMLAGLFLLTSVGFTALIFWQNSQKSETDQAQQELQESLTQQESLEDTTNETGENMLEGTQLANFTPTSEPVTELQKIDLVEGTGEVATEGATVTAHYTGALVSTGIIFQSSLDSGQPFTSPLSGLIVGWQEGIPGMKVGGTRRLIIPYAKAYGEAGSPPSIPGKADLVFDIQLISLEQ
jgi:FKBP-type peptidyl-prolyl cis-trans isomerase